MKFTTQCAIVLVLACVCDVLWAYHLLMFLENAMALACASVFAIHFVSFFQTVWFIEHKEMWKRLAITFAGATGAAIGCGIIMLWRNT
jgi:hypothetical protein